jgi:hypothetical protein
MIFPGPSLSYLERGGADHPTRSTAKSSACALAVDLPEQDN